MKARVDRYIRISGIVAAPLMIAALLLTHTGLLAYGAFIHSPTYNEPANLAAGVSYWQFQRFDLYPVNPPLVKLVAALPVLIVGCETDWNSLSHEPGNRDEMQIGRDFCRANGPRILLLSRISRWICLPFSLFGAVTCYLWGSRLYGTRAGLISMALWCFCPNVIAHGQLITSDVASASLGVFSCYAFWHWLKKPNFRTTLISGIALGFAESAKTTLIIFYPLWPAVWLAYRLSEVHSFSTERRRELASLSCYKVVNAPRKQSSPPFRHEMRLKDWSREAAQLLVRMLLSVFIVNFVYGFEGTFTPLKDYQFFSSALAASEDSLPKPERAYVASSQEAAIGYFDTSLRTKNRFSDSWLGMIPVPFPKHYIIGIDLQRRDFEAYHNRFFLAGRWSEEGWWYYYLYAAAVKVPIGTWILFLLACLTFFVGHMRNIGNPSFAVGNQFHSSPSPIRDEVFLLTPAIAIFSFVSSQTGINEHFRYVLPVFPFIYIWIGRVFAQNTIFDERNFSVFANWNQDDLRCSRADTEIRIAVSAGCDRLANHARCRLWPKKFRRLRCRQILISAAFVAVAHAITSSLLVYPHCLSYFNKLAGGPKNGSKYLLHSNIDWGQDLLCLKHWLDSRETTGSVYINCISGFDPNDIGIDSVSMPKRFDFLDQQGQQVLRAGTYAISRDRLARSIDPRSTIPSAAIFLGQTPIDTIGWSIDIFVLKEPRRFSPIDSSE